MSYQTSFRQILNEKLGNTSENPSSSSKIVDSDPAHMAFLMGQIGRWDFQTRKVSYPRPTTVRPQRKAHVMTAQERQSYEFLKTWIHDFSEGFTATELKKAFRHCAFILHPDQGGSAEQFVELKAHCETLSQLIAAK